MKLDGSQLYSFEEGIKETIAWYLNNENWWKKLRDI